MKRSTFLLSLIAASFLVDGLVRAFLKRGAEQPMAFVQGVMIAVLCYARARADATSREIVTPGRLAVHAGLFPLFGVPAHLPRTRGFAAGAKSVRG